jgi:putative phage-type endonuclease
MSKLAYKIVNVDQQSSEWHSWRRNKITASNAAAIMGLDPHTTPLELYNRILSGEEVPDNEFMKHGRETEAEARGWVAMQTGKAYIPTCMESIEYPWMACSLDGWREHLEPAALEIKCPMKTIEQFALLDEIPVPHFCQLQHQMCVAGIDKMYYVTYSKASQEGLILTIKRDDLFIKKLVEAEKAFYNRLSSFEPPDPIDCRDYVEIREPEAVNEANEYERACFEERLASAKKEKIRDKLIERAAGRSVKVGDLKITKVVSRGRVDYSSIPAIQNLDLDPYRKPNTTSWRFS